jgi:hypothetical protein
VIAPPLLRYLFRQEIKHTREDNLAAPVQL